MTGGERLVAALLLSAIAYAGWDAARLRSVDPELSGDVIAPRGVAASIPDADTGQAIVARALFLPGRRADPGTAGSGAVGGYVLRGTLSGPAGTLAVFEPVRGGAVRRLRPGQRIGGYALAAVEAESVVLLRGGERRRLPIAEPSLVAIDAAAGRAPAALPAGASRTVTAPDGEVLPVITTRDAEGM